MSSSSSTDRRTATRGRNVVDALQLGDGTLLLVNRGFVPKQTTFLRRRRARSRWSGAYGRANADPQVKLRDEGTGELTEIRRIDIAVLATQFDGTVLPMYVEQLESTPPDATSLQPIVAPTLDEGPHLSYTIQWFVFSICVIAGWVLAVRRSLAIRSGRVVKKRRSAYVPIADEESVKLTGHSPAVPSA